VTLLLLAFLALEAPVSATPCAPDDCLRRMRAVAPVTEAMLDGLLLPGWYKAGDPLLGGSDLYLFEDGTFVYTRWSDISPDTVYDKGRWHAEGRVIRFASDPDVTWPRMFFDHRRMVVHGSEGKPHVRLVGVDEELSFMEDLHRRHGTAGTEIVGLKWKQAWAPGEGARVRAEVLRDSWRPEFFAR
jgi:hypothetical protein